MRCPPHVRLCRSRANYTLPTRESKARAVSARGSMQRLGSGQMIRPVEDDDQMCLTVLCGADAQEKLLAVMGRDVPVVAKTYGSVE